MPQSQATACWRWATRIRATPPQSPMPSLAHLRSRDLQRAAVAHPDHGSLLLVLYFQSLLIHTKGPPHLYVLAFTFPKRSKRQTMLQVLSFASTAKLIQNHSTKTTSWKPTILEPHMMDPWANSVKPTIQTKRGLQSKTFLGELVLPRSARDNLPRL